MKQDKSEYKRVKLRMEEIAAFRNIQSKMPHDSVYVMNYVARLHTRVEQLIENLSTQIKRKDNLHKKYDDLMKGNDAS